MARHCCNAMRVEACVCQVNACAGIYGGEHYSDLGGGVRVAPNIPVDVDPVAGSPMGDGAPSRAGPIAKLFRDFAAFARLDFDGNRCVVVGGGYRVGRAGPPCIQFCGEQIKSLRRRQGYINRFTNVRCHGCRPLIDHGRLGRRLQAHRPRGHQDRLAIRSCQWGQDRKGGGCLVG